MNTIRLSSVLLFLFVVPFIMTYRIGPGDTPYWLFGLIFLGLIGFIFVDMLPLRQTLYERCKNVLLWLVVIVVLVAGFGSAIIVRHQTHPIFMVHDALIQQEEAIRFLVKGKNPYATSYANTPLAQWHYSDTEVNPALHYFVYEPFYFVSALPFYYISNHTIGYFDGRIPLLLFVFIALIIAWFAVKDKESKRQFVIFLAFSPAMIGYTLEGRSDMYVYGFFIVGLYLLLNKKFLLAGIPLALAFAIKQSIWPILPFYVALLYFNTHSVTKTLQYISLFMATFLVIIAPFFFWNQQAFLASTIYFLSGNVANGYPISGYGFGMILHEFGYITDLHGYFPFVVIQLIICLPLLGMLLLYLKKKPNTQRMILAYGIFLFIFWYLSRFFNNSHLAFLSVIFVTAYFWPDDQKVIK